MKIFGLVQDSIVDGPGFRFACFVQGCPHHCPGCHNPGSHDPDGGREMTVEEVAAELLRGSGVSSRGESRIRELRDGD